MRERMEMKTHTLGVALSAGWPMLLGLAFVAGIALLILPWRYCWPIIAVMVGVVALTFLMCLRLYLGVYLFLPATDIKGARIIARLGRNNEIEISNVLADEVIIKQGWIEKTVGVCHIRQKGTTIYLRGVSEPEKVKAWVAANFPKERKVEPIKSRKAKK